MSQSRRSESPIDSERPSTSGLSAVIVPLSPTEPILRDVRVSGRIRFQSLLLLVSVSEGRKRRPSDEPIAPLDRLGYFARKADQEKEKQAKEKEKAKEEEKAQSDYFLESSGFSGGFGGFGGVQTGFQDFDDEDKKFTKNVDKINGKILSSARFLCYLAMLELERFRAQQRHASWLPVFPGRKANFSFQHRIPAFINMNYLTTFLKSLHPRIDDDFVDRLNYYYTSSSMIIFSILVSAKQYVGHPIECWVPAQFTKGMEQYTENYCWVQNTYWIPFNEQIPMPFAREQRQIGYYQWVPFLLAIQAFLFYIPATAWRLLNSQSGINMHGILEMANDDHNIEPENRGRTVNILSRHIDDALRHQRDFGNKNKAMYLWACIRLGKFYGAYVSALYVICKILYLLNVFGQFFLLNKFLETDNSPFFGANVVWDMLSGREWATSGKFPRVTLCDFEIRVLGNLHRHTVQCVLVINMFTEKIFVVLWLWFLILTLATVLSLAFWAVTLSIPTCRMRIIQKYLELTENPPDPDKDSYIMHKFVVNFLRPDGVFILRMISMHAGSVITAEITDSLFQKFRTNNSRSPAIYATPSSPEKGPITIIEEAGPLPPKPIIYEKVDKCQGTEDPVPIPPLQASRPFVPDDYNAPPRALEEYGNNDFTIGASSPKVSFRPRPSLGFSPSPQSPLLGNHKPTTAATSGTSSSPTSPTKPPLSTFASSRSGPGPLTLSGQRPRTSVGGSTIAEEKAPLVSAASQPSSLSSPVATTASGPLQPNNTAAVAGKPVKAKEESVEPAESSCDEKTIMI